MFGFVAMLSVSPGRSHVLLPAVQIAARPPMAVGLGSRRRVGWRLVATVYAGFTQEFGFSTVNTVLNIPIGVQEMVLAVWLIAKGFNHVGASGPTGAAIDERRDGGTMT